jgi:dTDP-4-amino-4,6-dideoxygalactose transaminase
VIPKSRPYFRLAEFLAALTPGQGVADFEAAIAAKTGAGYALAFGYAHSGFYALLKVLNLTDVEIIIPAYTCDLVAEVIVKSGNIPVFVDIDLANFNMDLDQLKQALTPKTRMVVATPMFGYPTDVVKIKQIVASEQLFILEDAALSLPGATCLHGEAGLFSFGPGKPLFAVRGGIVTTNNSDLYEKLRLYRNSQMSRLPSKEWAKRWLRLLITYFFQTDAAYATAIRLGLVNASFERSATTMADTYDTPLADFQARIGLSLLGKTDLLCAKRGERVAWYNQALAGTPNFTPAPQITGASYTYYTARIKNRDALQFSQKMYQRGIQTGRTYDYAIPNFIQYRSFAKKSFPQAKQAGREVVNLPLHLELTESKAHYIADNVRQILQKNGLTE